MSKSIGQDELKHKIVTQIRNEGLDGIFNEDIIEKIRERVTREYVLKQETQTSDATTEEDSLHETNMRPPIAAGPSHFPYEDDFNAAENIEDSEIEMESPGIDKGSEPTNVPYEPKRAITPTVPLPLQDQQPGEIIVFDYNEVAAVSGENLANKPFRKKDDPENKQSIHDFWMQEGKTKVKVYAAKFEEIGEIEFNYTNGTAYFVDLKNPGVNNTINTYQENPYASNSVPQVDTINTETELRKTIESQVNLEDVLIKVMKDILKDGLKNEPIATEPTKMPSNNFLTIEDEPTTTVQERLSLEDVKKLNTVEVPKSIQQRLLGENVKGAEYISQSNEYAAYKVDGKMYYVINGDESKAYTSLDSNVS